MSYSDNDYINLEYYGSFDNMPHITISESDKSQVDTIFINSSFSGKVLLSDNPQPIGGEVVYEDTLTFSFQDTGIYVAGVEFDEFPELSTGNCNVELTYNNTTTTQICNCISYGDTSYFSNLYAIVNQDSSKYPEYQNDGVMLQFGIFEGENVGFCMIGNKSVELFGYPETFPEEIDVTVKITKLVTPYVIWGVTEFGNIETGGMCSSQFTAPQTKVTCKFGNNTLSENTVNFTVIDGVYMHNQIFEDPTSYIFPENNDLQDCVVLTNNIYDGTFDYTTQPELALLNGITNILLLYELTSYNFSNIAMLRTLGSGFHSKLQYVEGELPTTFNDDVIMCITHNNTVYNAYLRDTESFESIDEMMPMSTTPFISNQNSLGDIITYLFEQECYVELSCFGCTTLSELIDIVRSGNATYSIICENDGNTYTYTPTNKIRLTDGDRPFGTTYYVC